MTNIRRKIIKSRLSFTKLILKLNLLLMIFLPIFVIILKNDPAKVINFISDPNNALEAHEMGLITLDENSLEALKIVNDVSDIEETKTSPESKPEASEA